MSVEAFIASTMRDQASASESSRHRAAKKPGDAGLKPMRQPSLPRQGGEGEGRILWPSVFLLLLLASASPELGGDSYIHFSFFFARINFIINYLFIIIITLLFQPLRAFRRTVHREQIRGELL